MSGRPLPLKSGVLTSSCPPLASLVNTSRHPRCASCRCLPESPCPQQTALVTLQPHTEPARTQHACACRRQRAAGAACRTSRARWAWLLCRARGRMLQQVGAQLVQGSVAVRDCVLDGLVHLRVRLRRSSTPDFAPAPPVRGERAPTSKAATHLVEAVWQEHRIPAKIRRPSCWHDATFCPPHKGNRLEVWPCRQAAAKRAVEQPAARAAMLRAPPTYPAPSTASAHLACTHMCTAHRLSGRQTPPASCSGRRGRASPETT